MTKDKTPPHLATLILLPAFSVLSLNMFLPSLANIAADLDADYGTVSLSVAGYLAVTAIVQLVVGPLSDRIGRRPVLLAALTSFCIASVACSLATDILTFLIFRMLQGGIVSGYALSLAIVRDTTSERKAAGLIGYISMTMAIAPMLGPMLGGALDTAFGWRANFYFYAMFGLLLLITCWIDLGETKPAKLEQTGASPESLRTLIREPLFWAYSLCTTFSTGAFYIFLTGAPLVATSEFDVTTAQLGIYIGTITAGFMLGSFLSGRFAPQYEPSTMMLAGRLTACVGLTLGLVAMLMGYMTPITFSGSTIFVGLGNGLTIPSSNTSAMSVRPNLAGSAAGLNGALVVAGGAILTAFTGLILPIERAGVVLHMLMLAASGAGLASVLWAIRLQSQRRY
ncbi:multidrug effflux MFS transporter [Parasulfitobacter algicola]|uniref:Bcr/CflA family efflux transporter n=1 Tax=Parasulfitobacter algicola TaxID=2614809 RepID=A0ABX2IXN6_9RHOB|nr:multidrug effflux MFS transporter [Sulfitobacter algicola]NSX55108.1 multidrug effflux MFS transporter [Sulfitobacter algicola]